MHISDRGPKVKHQFRTSVPNCYHRNVGPSPRSVRLCQNGRPQTTLKQAGVLSTGKKIPNLNL